MPSNAWNFACSSYNILIPLGIIMPFNDVVANIPTGWEQYDGNDKAVLGHASVSGTEAGNKTWARATSTDGSHTGSRNISGSGSYTGSTYSLPFLGSNAGSHNHTFTLTYEPARRYQVLMKATQDHNKFPVNTGILSDISLDSMATDITPAGGETLYGAMIGGSNDNTNAVQSAIASAFSTGGSHHHLITNNGDLVDPLTGYEAYPTAGSHSTHSFSPSVTDAMYRYYMGMWASATSELSAIPGIYGMWESSTPPSGWAICDGTNGTPDLSGKHIGLDRSKIGTDDGDGTLNISGSFGTAGYHDHRIGSGYNSTNIVIYHGDSVSHSHTLGSSSISWTQEHKTLIFIKAL